MKTIKELAEEADITLFEYDENGSIVWGKSTQKEMPLWFLTLRGWSYLTKKMDNKKAIEWQEEIGKHIVDFLNKSLQEPNK